MEVGVSDLWKKSAVEVVGLLKKREVSPLDLVDVAEKRIAAVEPHVNALPTLCLDRAREHARALTDGKRREGEPEGE